MGAQRSVAAAIVAIAMICTGTAAFADGGGGGGGGGGQMTPPSSSNRSDPQVAYQAGVAALNERNYQEAIRQFRTARRELRNNSAINYALGLAYVGDSQPEEAQDSFERAVRADDAPAGAWLQLGLLHLQAGRRAEAVAQQSALSQQIAACDTACGDPRRAQLQAALDQLTRALEAPAAPSGGPSMSWNFPGVEEGRVRYAEAVGLINQDRFGDARDVLLSVHAAVGPNPDVLNYLGFVSRKLGRYDTALTYYHQALTVDPNHLGAIEYLGELYIQMGELDRARTQLAQLDRLCTFGCAQREELARWIDSAQ